VLGAIVEADVVGSLSSLAVEGMLESMVTEEIESEIGVAIVTCFF
jgi:hypothetical protein